MSNIKEQKGISLVLVVLISSILLTIAFGVSSILIRQTQSLRNVGFSVVSLCAADTGVEMVLMTRPPVDIPETELSNGATFKVEVRAGGEDGCDESLSYCIKSVGVFEGVKRAIEIRY